MVWSAGMPLRLVYSVVTICLVAGGLVFFRDVSVAESNNFACIQSGYREIRGKTLVSCEVPVSDTQTFEIRYRWKVGSSWSPHKSYFLRGGSSWRLTLREGTPDSGSFQFAWLPFTSGATLSNWIPVTITESPPTATATSTATATPTATATSTATATPTATTRPGIPTDASASLSADKQSIDVAWSVPSGADGVELSIVSRSDQVEVYRQEFSSSHKAGLDGVMYSFSQIKSSEAYEVKVRSYALARGGSKSYSEWANTVTLVIPPELTLCFLVPGNQPGADNLRCFWENSASVDEYEFEVRAKPSGDQIRSDNRFLTGVAFPVLQRPQRRLQRSAYFDVPTVEAGSQLEIRVRVKGPEASEWTEWAGVTAMKLAQLPPRCVQMIGQQDASGRHPIKCWLPYHRKSTLNIYYGDQRQQQVEVNGGVTEAIMLGSQSGFYTAKWHAGSNQESNGYNFKVNSYENGGCPANLDIGLPLSSRNDISSGYYFRPHPTDLVVKIHTGVDLGGYIGQPIYAAHNGIVIGIDYAISSPEGGTGYGNYMAIQHTNSENSKRTCWHSFYSHLLSPHHPNCRVPKIIKQIGTVVSKGERIGCVGSTGTSTGPHLHFEVRHGTENSYTRVANFSRNVLNPDLFQKYDPIALLASASGISNGAVSLPPQLPNATGCPSMVNNPDSCEQYERDIAAGIPAVRCASGPASVVWYWNVPKGTGKFRWSNSAATSYAGWTTSADSSKTNMTLPGSSGQRPSLYVQAKRDGDSYWSWSGSASCVVKPRELLISCSSTSSSNVWSWPKPVSWVSQEVSFDGLSWAAHRTGAVAKRSLKPGDGYTLYVRGRNSGDTHWSWEGSKACGAVPMAPSVKCVAEATSITWTWDTSDSTSSFRSCYFLGSTLGHSSWMQESGNSRTKSGLSLGDEIALEVQGINEWGPSIMGSAKCETTNKTAPNPPTVRCVSATADSSIWNWNSPTGSEKFQTRYSVNVWPGYSNWVPQNGNSRRVTGLAPTIVMMLYVQAGNSAGWSSDGSAFCTNPYEIPDSPDVECSPITSSITWEWTAVKWATRYQTSYDGLTWTEQTSRSKTRENLSSGTKLRLYVKAGNPAGMSDADWADCTVKSSTGK